MDTPRSPPPPGAGPALLGPADPAPRPHLGTPARRAPPARPPADRADLSRQRRFVFGLLVLSAVAVALSLATRRPGARGPAAEPSLALPLAAATPEPLPPWDDARVRSAAAATARGAAACVDRHAEAIGALPGPLDLIVHLPPAGPIDLRLAGPAAAGLRLPPAFVACLAEAAAAEPFPRPIGDRQVRVPLPELARLRAQP